jgi:hypothetical protein
MRDADRVDRHAGGMAERMTRQAQKTGRITGRQTFAFSRKFVSCTRKHFAALGSNMGQLMSSSLFP